MTRIFFDKMTIFKIIRSGNRKFKKFNINILKQFSSQQKRHMSKNIFCDNDIFLLHALLLFK